MILGIQNSTNVIPPTPKQQEQQRQVLKTAQQPDVYFSASTKKSGKSKWLFGLLAATGLVIGADAITGGNLLTPIKNIVISSQELSTHQKIEARMVSNIVQLLNLETELLEKMNAEIQSNPTVYSIDGEQFNNSVTQMAAAKAALQEAGITPEAILTMKPSKAEKELFAAYMEPSYDFAVFISENPESINTLMKNTPFYEETYLPQRIKLEESMDLISMESAAAGVNNRYKSMWF